MMGAFFALAGTLPERLSRLAQNSVSPPWTAWTVPGVADAFATAPAKTVAPPITRTNAADAAMAVTFRILVSF